MNRKPPLLSVTKVVGAVTLLDENGQPIATIGKKLVSVHDKYCIDLYRPEEEQVVVAIVIQLEKMLEARQENDD